MGTGTLRGADAFVRLLRDEGVAHLFGNPGTTELALMEALAAQPGLPFVLALQEASVVGMADGYARASGRLAACILHAAPGLGNAMGALYNAKFSGSPVLVAAGQHETGHGLQEPMLYEPLVELARPLVKWAAEVPRLQDLPRLVHRAATIALAPPAGPVFLSLPGDVMDAVGELELGTPTRVDARVRPSDDLLRELAARLLRAQRPAIIAGRELANRDAFAEAEQLAEVLGAGVFHEPVPYNARFRTTHPAFLGDLTRRQETARRLLEPFDLVVCLGADLLRMSVFSPVDPLPVGMGVVHITERDAELGKNHPVELAVRADVKETLRAVLPLLHASRSDAQAANARDRLHALADRNWLARRTAAREQALRDAKAQPITNAFMAMTLADVVPPDAVVVEEALTTAAPLATFLPVESAERFYGLASGGLGFALPGAVGIALANPGRRVVAVIGDGSAMYSVQALWTAAQQRLPVTFVVVNNGGYRILKERLVARGRAQRMVGMDLAPAVDFGELARGMGVPASRVTSPADLADALRRGLAGDGPQLVEVIAADAAEATRGN